MVKKEKWLTLVFSTHTSCFKFFSISVNAYIWIDADVSLTFYSFVLRFRMWRIFSVSFFEIVYNVPKAE